MHRTAHWLKAILINKEFLEFLLVRVKINLKEKILSLIKLALMAHNKESACNAGDLSSIPGSGRSPGKGNGYLLQCSCLENPMDKGAWWATVHGVTKSQTGLSD